jgi:hypothetical protein
VACRTSDLSRIGQNSRGSAIFSITLFWEVSDPEIWRRWTKEIRVSMVKISAIESQYFWRYSLWKLGFLNNPENMFQTSQLGISAITSFMWLCRL